MPMYSCQPPTGYKDTADAWVSTGALVNRMNVALALASNRMRGIAVDSGLSPVDGHESAAAMLSGDVSEATLATISKATTAPQMTALTLGAPEFQRR
jgi:uncharacterized protein (DUF1800 family)